MNRPVKSLEKLKKEAKKEGYGVRKWAKLAGLEWQVVYRRLRNDKHLRLHEYLKLEAAVKRMKDNANHLSA